MIALQLNPPLVVSTPLGDGWAHVLIDYGAAFNSTYVVELESGDFKHFNTEQLRSCGNHTFEFKRGEPKEEQIGLRCPYCKGPVLAPSPHVHECLRCNITWSSNNTVCATCEGKGETLQKNMEGGYEFKPCPSCK